METAAQHVPFLKGHGTENDFVIIPDPDGALELSDASVRRVCDRRAGIGADGLLRVVRSAAHPEARGLDTEWFMDYRNSDGSVAEMCGNGVRVFARYLHRAGLVPAGELAVGTRAGVRHVHLGEQPTGRDGAVPVTVRMGRPVLPADAVTVTVGGRSLPARHVSMGNPHAVVFVDTLADAGPLTEPPLVEPADVYPAGTNVEFVAERGPRHIALRVHERGSGETRSCGTGACAAMVAAARRHGADPVTDGVPTTYDVDVPGGRLVITERADGEIEMTGPAVVLAEGTLDADWLAG